MRPRFCPIVALLGLLLFSGLSEACVLGAGPARQRICLALHRPVARLLHRRLRQDRGDASASVAAAVALGDSLFEKWDFDGAIAAYTKGIKL